MSKKNRKKKPLVACLRCQCPECCAKEWALVDILKIYRKRLDALETGVSRASAITAQFEKY